ncbi:hypothetical protein [Alkalimarinus alittae]|uniref:Uncharacterized protein n=1 Tax=Alkalimarinus alittae TaxID=2961619 RepID=A0ABY6MY02_9ALTE|nr:hypothetical protein [Alkalimarinus alittae]UZE94657.1 hypothetical protein NKI27_11225 [Alkalimarinus alittae]
MLIDAGSLKQQIISPTLKYLNETNAVTAKLLVGTAAVETGLTPLRAYDASKEDTGIGLYNISQRRHMDIWDNYLAFDPDLASQIRGLASQRTFLSNPHDELNTNLAYATSIAWCIYRRAKVALSEDSIQYLAAYWHRHFRPQKSHHNQHDFCESYKRLVLGITSPINEQRPSRIINIA